VFRDFKILDTYTIESSCFGFEVKGTDQNNFFLEPKMMQFSASNLLTFGEHLLQGLAKHLAVEVTELDLNTVVSGFKIDSDFSLG
jgi:hypothetical protein